MDRCDFPSCVLRGPNEILIKDGSRKIVIIGLSIYYTRNSRSWCGVKQQPRFTLTNKPLSTIILQNTDQMFIFCYKLSLGKVATQSIAAKCGRFRLYYRNRAKHIILNPRACYLLSTKVRSKPLEVGWLFKLILKRSLRKPFSQGLLRPFFVEVIPRNIYQMMVTNTSRYAQAYG